VKAANRRLQRTDPEIGGFQFISWKSMQPRAGITRQSLSVVDLGDVRIVLPGTNLAVF